MAKNPFRKYENFKNICNNDFMSSFESLRAYYFYKILNLYCSRYIWKNLPEEIEPFFIERTQFYKAYGAFIYDDVVESYAFMNVTLAGMPDIYNIPDMRFAYAANGYLEEYGKENSVICWDNYTCFPFVHTAFMYANSLANAWKTRDINMFAQRTPVVLLSSDEEVLTFETIGQDYNNYVPILKLKDSVNLDRIKALNIEAPYIVDKIEAEIRALTSQLLTDLGYESNPTEKKERVTISETQGNNGEVEAMRNVGLMCRRRAANAINELWGLNVEVEFNSQLPTMVNGFVPNNYVESHLPSEEGNSRDE